MAYLDVKLLKPKVRLPQQISGKNPDSKYAMKIKICRSELALNCRSRHSCVKLTVIITEGYSQLCMKCYCKSGKVNHRRYEILEKALIVNIYCL